MKEVLKINKAIQDGSLDELKQNIGFEIFDVVWNIFDIANKFNIDLEEAFKKKMEINNQRSWQ
ncbi:hypothetical protein PAESOLCIP111_06480 [Paenibacillus solanacearum]|uniref:Pyrophosphatase n=1 Tax=Paenibacillus solanacearum TaxID=2048548 RepID=A0A916K808_9BACL|nr:hypothetical protein PAESOLCIP111_06480 [Paenibacillus solanacearum]